MNGTTNNFFSFGKQILAGTKALKTARLSSFRKVFSLMSKKEKIVLSVLALLALITFYVSLRNAYYNQTLAAPDFGGNYTEGLKGQPVYINPVLAFSETDLSLTRLVYSGLYKYNTDGKLVPDLAESLPEISEDQKQYTVNLKKNVKWHNDRLFTAEDVIFTFQILKDPSFKSPNRNTWLSTNVEKLSDFVVRFTTKDVAGPFLPNLTQPILPKFVWNKTDSASFPLSENNLKAVGTGPYLIKEIKKSNGEIQSISLNSFSNYFEGKSKIDTLTFKFFDSDESLFNALHSGQIQGFGFTGTGELKTDTKKGSESGKITLAIPQYQMLYFNLNNKFLKDISLRQVLSKTIDQDKIISTAFNSQAQKPNLSVFKNLSLELDLSSNFDLETAKNELETLGWIVDPSTGFRTKKNETLELNLTTNDLSANVKTAEIISNAWQSLNIKVNLQVLPSKQISEEVIRPRQFDTLILSQKFSEDPDPFVLWHSSQIKDPGINITGLEDSEIDKLLTEGRTTTNTQIRKNKYEEFYSLFLSKTPAVFITQAQYIYFLKNNIKNFKTESLLEPSYRFFGVNEWYIEERRVWK
jgi:peptide/nickel transport system substrate-binding protein